MNLSLIVREFVSFGSSCPYIAGALKPHNCAQFVCDYYIVFHVLDFCCSRMLLVSYPWGAVLDEWQEPF